MSGVGDHEVDGSAGARVTQVVQGARVDAVAAGTMATARAAAGGVVTAAAFDAGLREVLGGGDALGDVGDVFAWPEPGCVLHTQTPPWIHFTPGGPHSGHP
jgi:hypothetical protein